MGCLCGSGVVCEAAHLLCAVELCAAACACLLLLLLLLHVGVPVVTAASFTTTTAFCWGAGDGPAWLPVCGRCTWGPLWLQCVSGCLRCGRCCLVLLCGLDAVAAPGCGGCRGWE